MPIVVEKTLYLFNELSDDAKECARNWWRNASQGDNFYAEPVYDDAANTADCFGLDIRQTRKNRMDGSHFYDASIYYSGFWSQGDGACFMGQYTYKKGAAKAIRAYAPQDVELHRIADELQRIQKRNFYSVTASTCHRGHYYHSGCMSVDVDNRNGNVSTDDENDIKQCMRDFADWIYRQLEKAYEWENSDESIADAMEANEYTFNECGKRED